MHKLLNAVLSIKSYAEPNCVAGDNRQQRVVSNAFIVDFHNRFLFIFAKLNIALCYLRERSIIITCLLISLSSINWPSWNYFNWIIFRHQKPKSDWVFTWMWIGNWEGGISQKSQRQCRFVPPTNLIENLLRIFLRKKPFFLPSWALFFFPFKQTKQNNFSMEFSLPIFIWLSAQRNVG